LIANLEPYRETNVQEQIESRLDELKQEFTRGQARFQEVDAQQSALRETLLRISGAIQVLEEVLAGDAAPAS
jgi:prefoldin subunit 5